MSSSSDRSPPVYRGRNLCLAAPAAAEQGVDTFPLILLAETFRSPYSRWKTVCDKSRSHSFVPRAIQARALVDGDYLV